MVRKAGLRRRYLAGDQNVLTGGGQDVRTESSWQMSSKNRGPKTSVVLKEQTSWKGKSVKVLSKGVTQSDSEFKERNEKEGNCGAKDN